MSETHITILLLVCIAAFGWVVVRVVRTLGAGGESSTRADTLASGAGYGAERMDTLSEQATRRPIVGGGGGNA